MSALGVAWGLSGNTALVLGMAPTLIGGGALLGLCLGGKAIYWGLALGYAMSRGFVPDDPDAATRGLWLLLVLTSATVSDTVNAQKMRRKTLV